MVDISLSEGTITLNHEWPVDKRASAYEDGEPVVSLEVDTEYGTAVVGLNFAELIALADDIDGFIGYYDTLAEDEWNSR